jgi:hypothetical protein
MSEFDDRAGAIFQPFAAFCAEIGGISCSGVSLAPAGPTSAIPQVAKPPGGVDVRVTTRSAFLVRTAIVALLTVTTWAGAAGTAFAQNDPNPGALTFTGGLDFPSLYFFRGIRQETDPGLTMWPYGDLGIALHSGDGGVKSVGVNVGVWNSLHTGSSGSDGISGKLHYEEDFYTTLNLGFGGGITVGTTYMALTSPNQGFATVKELQFKVSKAHWLGPYGFLAFELSDDGQADGGHTFGGSKGTYLELGVAPSWPLGDGVATLAVPVKVGFGLSNYYEQLNADNSITSDEFGFFDVGGLVTFPLKGIPSSFGSWNLHAGLDWLTLGDMTRNLNRGTDGEDSSTKVVFLFGIGLTY